MIIQDIDNIAADFTKETGKMPRYIYLGETEVEKLLEMIFSSCIFQLEIKSLPNVYNGMAIIEVKVESHLRAS